MEAAASKKKDTSGAKKNAATQGKKRKKQTKDEDDDLESDGEDGIPGGKLRRIQKHLFDTCLRGKAEFDKWNNAKSAPKSFKAMKSQAGVAMDIFRNATDEEMVKFKKEQIDPIVKEAKVAINEYVISQADTLRNELSGDFFIHNSDEEGEDYGAEEGDGEHGKEKGKQIMNDDKKVDNVGVDKSEDDSSAGLSEGEVEGGADKVESGGANAACKSGVIEGSDDKESS